GKRRGCESGALWARARRRPPPRGGRAERTCAPAPPRPPGGAPHPPAPPRAPPPADAPAAGAIRPRVEAAHPLDERIGDGNFGLRIGSRLGHAMLLGAVARRCRVGSELRN